MRRYVDQAARLRGVAGLPPHAVEPLAAILTYEAAILDAHERDKALQRLHEAWGAAERWAGPPPVPRPDDDVLEVPAGPGAAWICEHRRVKRAVACESCGTPTTLRVRKARGRTWRRLCVADAESFVRVPAKFRGAGVFSLRRAGTHAPSAGLARVKKKWQGRSSAGQGARQKGAPCASLSAVSPSAARSRGSSSQRFSH